MSTVKNSTVKNSASNVNSISLKGIADKLKDVVFETKVERVNLYIYPENLKTEKERNGKDGKAFRRKLRTQLEKHMNHILNFVKYNRQEDLKNEIKAFKSFYKTNYRINDFTVTSVSQSAKDEKLQFLKMMFEVIQISEAKKEKKEKTVKPEIKEETK